MLNFPCHMVTHREFHFVLMSETIEGKHLKEDVGLSGLVLQSNGSNCLMLILQRYLEKYLLSIRNTYGPTSQHICKAFKSMFDTYQQIDYPLRACWTESWCQSVVVMHPEQQHLAALDILGESPACQMDTRETPGTKATDVTTLKRVPVDTCR